ncbi:TetR/AcrR family transcriptional regulator [Actinoallomurus purpureus]|uniref:TetR/AcrR family transcriptional regulator n=1 Tax=Actinoallomurus purpureus TaxID=478114 RepID=UPI0020920B4A|nr:TetR/AcrR family transcriptional regulator [Actinoallomurus purpureus]MCO6011145.1 TetR/AcrR family transcriptional regulator [Actinoallomurus purpureus]
MLETPDRRERKKRRTRALIRETALELFASAGYDATTIKAIADAADVAPRTVTLHFPAKEDMLALDDPFGPESLATRLAARGDGETALAALRDWMITTIRAIEEGDPEEARRFWRLRALRAQVIADDEALRGRTRASYVKAERVLAAALGADLGLPPTALVPRLAAQAAVTGLREVYEADEARTAGPEPRAADLVPLVDRVIEFVHAGLAAVRGLPRGRPT